MGCCYSLSSVVDHHRQNLRGRDPPLTKFSYSDLVSATQNFSWKNILSEGLYKGRLKSLGLVAVKKYNSMAWPDPNQFSEEARRVGKLRHKRVVKMIGYCCDEDERLLVAEFLPSYTLAQRLFHQISQTVEWDMRFRVAYSVAEALDYCNTLGFASYDNLSASKVLFNEDGDACLSCFGLMKGIKDDQRTTGSVDPKSSVIFRFGTITGSVDPKSSVIFRFGTILVELLTGRQIPPSYAPKMIHGKRVTELIDPNLKGNFSAEEASVVFKLASQCLHNEDIENLNTKSLVTRLETLQTKTNDPSYDDIHEKQKHKEVSWTHISPLGEACSRMDLEAIHKILVMAGYKDDKEVIELSFEEWIQEFKDLEEVRKRGDRAFVEQDFRTAIECYSQFIEGRRMVYPSVYARRSLCYLFCNQPERSLRDGMQAQEVFPDWPTAFYLQSVALSKLNMNTDSSDILKEAALLEAKRQHR